VVTVSDAIVAAARQLAATSTTPRLDAELLMAHALGTSREALLLSRMGDDAPPAFAELLARRLAHEPVAYITGRRAFWTIELEVGPGVLIPRPDSETLLEAAVEHFAGRGPSRILDLGTGPGTLLLAALDQWPHATGLGVDRSRMALDWAEKNKYVAGVGSRATFIEGDWGANVGGTFDLILCNPPYVEAAAELASDVADYEPAEALFAGPDGLDDYRRIAPQIPRLLATGGIACIEIGIGQASEVCGLFTDAGLSVSIRDDIEGRARCVVVLA
jgi:release factor glutamine methyltransferase